MTVKEACEILKIDARQLRMYKGEGRVRVIPIVNGGRKEYSYNTEDVYELARCLNGPCTVPYFYAIEDKTTKEQMDYTEGKLRFFCSQQGYKGVRDVSVDVLDSLGEAEYPSFKSLRCLKQLMKLVFEKKVERIVLPSLDLFPQDLNFEIWRSFIKDLGVKEIAIVDRTTNPRQPYII